MTDTNTFTPVEQPKKKSAPIAMIFTTVILAAALIFSGCNVFRSEKQNGRYGNCSHPGKRFSSK